MNETQTVTMSDLVEALRLCLTNADTAAHYASGTPKDTSALQNAPNWPGVTQGRALLARIDAGQPTYVAARHNVYQWAVVRTDTGQPVVFIEDQHDDDDAEEQLARDIAARLNLPG